MLRNLLLFLVLFSTSLSYSQKQGNNPQLAQQYFLAGEYDKAAEIYEKLFSSQPSVKVYYERYIASLGSLKEYDKAEKVIKRQVKRYPDILRFRVDLGSLYIKAGNADKGKREYENTILMLKDDPAMITDLANAFSEIEEQGFALQTLLKGRKLLNDEYAFSNEILKLYSRKNDKGGIVSEILTLIDKDELYLPQAKNNLQDYLSDPKDFDVLKAALLKRIQRSPENNSYSDLLIWTFIQQRNFEMALTQTIAADKRSNSDGSAILTFAGFCISNGAYDVAIKAYNNIIERGPNNPFYMRARLELLEVKNKKIVNSDYTPADLTTLETDYNNFIKEFGKNTQTAFAMTGLANLEAKYLNKSSEASALMEEVLERNLGSPQFLSQVKLDLGDIYMMTGEIWEAALLYGQVDKSYRDEPLGQQAKFRNARLSYYAGEFDWAKAQLDVLKASTSQLIANDALNLSLVIADNTGLDTTTDALRMYARADLLIYRNRFDEALRSLDSINLLYPGHALADEILWSKSMMLIKKNNYTEALATLKKVYDEFAQDIWADDAIFRSAEIYEQRLKDNAKAMELYQLIIDKYPGSLLVVDARKRFRALRGDVLN